MKHLSLSGRTELLWCTGSPLESRLLDSSMTTDYRTSIYQPDNDIALRCADQQLDCDKPRHASCHAIMKDNQDLFCKDTWLWLTTSSSPCNKGSTAPRATIDLGKDRVRNIDCGSAPRLQLCGHERHSLLFRTSTGPFADCLGSLRLLLQFLRLHRHGHELAHVNGRLAILHKKQPRVDGQSETRFVGSLMV